MRVEVAADGADDKRLFNGVVRRMPSGEIMGGRRGAIGMVEDARVEEEPEEEDVDVDIGTPEFKVGAGGGGGDGDGVIKRD